VTTTRRVLHVLPHPGGGGETYVDLLSGMDGYRMDRVYLAPSPSPRPALARGLTRAARAARRADLVHVSGDAAAILCMPLLAAKPSVVTLHGLNLVRRVSGLRQRSAAFALRLVVRTATRTICVSESERIHLGAAIGARAAERAVVVSNGVSVPPALAGSDRAALRAELGLDASQPVAVWVGALEAHKDPLTVARAALQTPLTLLFVGDGRLRPELETIASSGERVRLLGVRSDLGRLLVASDVFVLSSYREGLSFALLEAMAAGLAPVVSDVVDNTEVTGDAGIHVAVGDEAAYVEAFRRLADDAELRAAAGRRARERVASSFSVDTMVRLTREVYEDVLAERQPRTRPVPTAQ
jgi:glycosyltransferase involved in cell wall biosynthesis